MVIRGDCYSDHRDTGGHWTGHSHDYQTQEGTRQTYEVSGTWQSRVKGVELAVRSCKLMNCSRLDILIQLVLERSMNIQHCFGIAWVPEIQ